ncbi:MAG: carboxylesterase family protein [Alphaproteobacteria bacterium]|nr:carboxylesterase family protein [Alphaproteobacteria bacterium]
MNRRQLLRGAALGLAAAPGAAHAAVTPIVETTSGPVRGLYDGGVAAFKGVRYGAAPVGPLRFKPPQPPARSQGVISAIDYGAPAVQMIAGPAVNPNSDLSMALSPVFPVAAEVRIDDEDCLYLNVWTKGLGDGGARPIMVWLHGGGFMYGSGAWPMYNGRNLSERGDVVVVTVNHRLNAFGYLHFGEVDPAFANSGNAGMLDIVLALQWVRDNAAAFGGDAGNVTIMGESGGGAKVSTLLAMPAARGLFHRAIIQSGPGVRGIPGERATAFARSVLANLNVETPAQAQTLPSGAIVGAAARAIAALGPDAAFRALGPVVDGDSLPRHPFDPDAPTVSADVPVLIGWNKDEMSLFNAGAPDWGTLTEETAQERVAQMNGARASRLMAALRRAFPDYSPTYLWNAAVTANAFFIDSVRIAERKAAQRAAPAYMYTVTWETPVGGGVFKSPHTIEIPMMFDTVETSRALMGPGPEPLLMAARMSEAWIAFARTGNPATPDLPAWPAYDARRRATMQFDIPCRLVEDPLGEVRRALS